MGVSINAREGGVWGVFIRPKGRTYGGWGGGGPLTTEKPAEPGISTIALQPLDGAIG